MNLSQGHSLTSNFDFGRHNISKSKAENETKSDPSKGKNDPYPFLSNFKKTFKSPKMIFSTMIMVKNRQNVREK